MVVRAHVMRMHWLV